MNLLHLSLFPRELTEDLHFNMSGLLDELFHKKCAVAERRQGF